MLTALCTHSRGSHPNDQPYRHPSSGQGLAGQITTLSGDTPRMTWMSACLHLGWDPKSHRRNADAVHTEDSVCAVHLWRNGKTLLFRGWSWPLFWLLGQDSEVLVPSPTRWKMIDKRGFFFSTKWGEDCQNVTICSQKPRKMHAPLSPAEFGVLSVLALHHLQIGWLAIMSAWE